MTTEKICTNWMKKPEDFKYFNGVKHQIVRLYCKKQKEFILKRHKANTKSGFHIGGQWFRVCIDGTGRYDDSNVCCKYYDV
jgi:hypothetical protein